VKLVDISSLSIAIGCDKRFFFLTSGEVVPMQTLVREGYKLRLYGS
jgi:hypothetical protein